MKNFNLKTLLTIGLLAAWGVTYGQALIQDLDNFAIHPFGTTFSPTAKFAAIGESGGVVGPTSTGCDLYGFRSQINPDAAVNIGMRIVIPPSPLLRRRLIPTISTSTNKALTIVEENTLTPIGPTTGCGSLLASFKQSTSTNNVLTIYGSATASGGSWTTSDRTLKRNIEPIQNALDIIEQLQGYTYEYRRDERLDLNLPQGQRYGFITQEVQKVMPTIVRRGTDLDGNPADYQIMEYNAIIPVLTEAVKLQQDVITDLEGNVTELEGVVTNLEGVVTNLEQENSALEARLARLEALMMGDKAGATTKPLDGTASGIALSQNRPNPANGTTVIQYTLPKAMTNATLVVVDLNGREISTQAINDVNGVVELNTQTWAAGTYIYSVVVDGRALAQKKMVVQ